jgi:hypothetical protein
MQKQLCAFIAARIKESAQKLSCTGLHSIILIQNYMSKKCFTRLEITEKYNKRKLAAASPEAFQKVVFRPSMSRSKGFAQDRN